MKIRILDKGFANLTGPFGTVEFVDGVSVDEVSAAEAARLGTILSVECVDSGKNPSTTQLMVDIHAKNTEELGIKAAGLRKATTVQPQVADNQPESVPQASHETVKAVLEGTPALKYDYDVEQLDALVKREGIAGLRAFASAYAVNGQSVATIIKKLMELKAENVKPEQEEPKKEEPTAEEVEEARKAEILAELEALGKRAIAIASNSELTEEEKLAQLAEVDAAIAAFEQE